MYEKRENVRQISFSSFKKNETPYKVVSHVLYHSKKEEEVFLYLFS